MGDFTVQISGSGFAMTWIGGIDSDTQPEIFIMEIEWDGNTSTVMEMVHVDPLSNTATHNLFVLDGAPLPANPSPAELDALYASITLVRAVTGGPFGPGTSMVFSDLPGVTTSTDGYVEGTDGDNYLSGTSGDDVILPGHNTGGDTIELTPGQDVIDLSGAVMPDDYSIVSGALYSWNRGMDFRLDAEQGYADITASNTAGDTARIRRKISDKNGRVYNDDMIVVTGNAACAIALREAILKGVPKALWRKAYDEAEGVIAGDIKTLAERREGAIRAFAVWGVTPEQIFSALEIEGLDDIGLDEIGTLSSMFRAIKAGEQKVEDYFPAKTNAAAGVEAAKGTAGKLAEIAKSAEKAEKAENTPADSEPGHAASTTPTKRQAAPAPRKTGPAAMTITIRMGNSKPPKIAASVPPNAGWRGRSRPT